MRGSGLSLERFIKGKAHRTKSEAKSKKKTIIRKAQRRREYEKVKKREQTPGDEAATKDENETHGPTSFYDRFFSELKNNEAAEASSKHKERHQDFKPDPFFKAKKKAETAREERQRITQEKQKRKEEMEKKVNQRKKRHVKLSVRTATGQPVVRNQITDILARLQAEKNAP